MVILVEGDGIKGHRFCPFLSPLEMTERPGMAKQIRLDLLQIRSRILALLCLRCFVGEVTCGRVRDFFHFFLSSSSSSLEWGDSIYRGLSSLPPYVSSRPGPSALFPHPPLTTPRDTQRVSSQWFIDHRHFCRDTTSRSLGGHDFVLVLRGVSSFRRIEEKIYYVSINGRTTDEENRVWRLDTYRYPEREAWSGSC